MFNRKGSMAIKLEDLDMMLNDFSDLNTLSEMEMIAMLEVWKIRRIKLIENPYECNWMLEQECDDVDACNEGPD